MINTQEELVHYGVKGMRWGIRRGRKKLSSASTKAERAKAVESLKKVKAKSEKKIGKLDREIEKKQQYLSKNRDRLIDKANRADYKYTYHQSKVYGWRGGVDRTRQTRANLWNAKAQKYRGQIKYAEDLIAKNERLKSEFNKGINEIDSLIKERGKKYIKK